MCFILVGLAESGLGRIKMLQLSSEIYEPIDECFKNQATSHQKVK